MVGVRVTLCVSKCGQRSDGLILRSGPHFPAGYLVGAETPPDPTELRANVLLQKRVGQRVGSGISDKTQTAHEAYPVRRAALVSENITKRREE